MVAPSSGAEQTLKEESPLVAATVEELQEERTQQRPDRAAPTP